MRVFLAGLVLPNVQNHSLAVLGNALDRDGIVHATVPFGGWHDVEPVLAHVLARQDDDSVFGLSIQNTEAALTGHYWIA